MEDLEFFDVGFGGIRKPDRGGIGDYRADEGTVGVKEGFFLVAPGGAS